MKIFYLTGLIVSLFLIGCSSTYKVSNFSSKDKFYEDFNKFARNKNVDVTLANDSSFTIDNGVAIRNDTLYQLGREINSGNLELTLSSAKEINYTSNDYKSASILLKNGEKYQAEKIKLTQDSITFAYIKEVIIMNDIVPMNKVKKISYKNHWLGVITGFIGGTLSGGVVGLFTVFSTTANGGGISGQDSRPNPFGSAPYLILSGIFIGSAIGWIVGDTNTYQFNP